MQSIITSSLNRVVSIAVTSTGINSYLQPIILSLIGLASLVVVFFLIQSGIVYITSSGNPEKLAQAKKIIRNCLLGIVLIIASSVLTSILIHSYSLPTNSASSTIPTLNQVQIPPSSNSIVNLVINTIIGLLRSIVVSIGSPFIKALSFFTHKTPLMAVNRYVFNLWLVMAGMADGLFTLVLILLGFQIISGDSIGIEEIDIRKLLPQIIITFLLINSSIFIIDLIINISNIMITVLYHNFPGTTVWNVLIDITKQSSVKGLAALMILVVFICLSVILLIYYVTRLVSLYLGAILSPIIMMLSILPSFKDFAHLAIRSYLSTIFVIFIHVTILLLASILFSSLLNNQPLKNTDPIMPTIIGIATLVSLLKTQKILIELNYLTIGPKAIRQLSNHFVNGISFISRSFKD